MRSAATLLLTAAVIAACSDGSGSPSTVATASTVSPAGITVRIALVGDIMTGRGVSEILAHDPDGVFAGVRHMLTDADLAGGNLESPLTTRPHLSANENQLEADPATAVHLAGAGFDLLSLPNNHSTDAGIAGLLDTITAVGDAGLTTVGAGDDAGIAYAPHIETVHGIRIGFLAYDATGVGIPAGDGPGIAGWDEEVAAAAMTDLRSRVDVVVVSIHGGAEYLPATDPGMAEIAAGLVDAGADVIWGHGAHVVQPVAATAGDRPSVIATSLGNFLFDQPGPDRTTGYLLEVMVDALGVVAYRVAVIEHPDRRVALVDWLEPEGDAAWVDGSWWSLTRPVSAADTTTTNLDEFRHGDLVAAAVGDIDSEGAGEVVASFRRPHRSTPFMETHPEVQWADRQGRSAHLGVYTPNSLDEVWVAGSVLMPVASLEVCDGSLAVVHDRLDDATPVAAGAWTWNGFGFDTASTLNGAGTPACADVNGDGETDPVILNRR